MTALKRATKATTMKERILRLRRGKSERFCYEMVEVLMRLKGSADC